MESLFILVALATVAGAILSIRSAVGVMLVGYTNKVYRVTNQYNEEKQRRCIVESELWILKDYQRFQPEYPQPGMSIHTHEIETLVTDPVLVRLEYNDQDYLKHGIRSQMVHAIAKSLFDTELIEIQTRDEADRYTMHYGKQMRAIIRVLNPKAKSIEQRGQVQVPHYGHFDINPPRTGSPTNSRIKPKPKPKK